MSSDSLSGLKAEIRRQGDAERMSNLDARSRWLALYVLCLASLMIVLDVTIVNVALPSIRDDLGFSETSLAWVVNAYVLTYGGFLLLGGLFSAQFHDVPPSVCFPRNRCRLGCPHKS